MCLVIQVVEGVPEAKMQRKSNEGYIIDKSRAILKENPKRLKLGLFGLAMSRNWPIIEIFMKSCGKKKIT